MTVKPRLLFFQRRYDRRLPLFLQLHLRDHVACLSRFFDVTVIRESCDYDRVCERHRPDIALFETGPNLSTSRRLTITNTRAHPRIPKLGLLNADGWSETRAGSLSEMDHWGIETLFSISVTAAEHMPALASRIFTWPNAIDPAIYRRYGERKRHPVLLTGSVGPQYPWRRAVFPRLAARYPALRQPHPGYYGETGAPAVCGEPYARTINASWCVPACGTVANEVVRKLFEVPASGACLVAPWFPGLEAAGFVDMVNCVIADETDVVDKVDALFRDMPGLEAIITAGHELAHSRHTLGHRDQILQWLTLFRRLGPGEHIVQRHPFAPLTTSRSPGGISLPSNGRHLALLQRAHASLRAGRYREAEADYLACLALMRALPEARFGLALCRLHVGDATSALSWMTALLESTLAEYRAFDPDPVEWAWYVVTLLALGKRTEATRRARQFPHLSHRELAYVRVALDVAPRTTPAHGARADRPSIHELPPRPLADWVEHVRCVLAVCGQARLAETLRSGGADAGPTTGHGRGGSSTTRSRHVRIAAVASRLVERLDDPRAHFRCRRRLGRWRRHLRDAVGSARRRLSVTPSAELPAAPASPAIEPERATAAGPARWRRGIQ